MKIAETEVLQRRAGGLITYCLMIISASVEHEFSTVFIIVSWYRQRYFIT
jgi:hypothetical protein